MRSTYRKYLSSTQLVGLPLDTWTDWKFPTIIAVVWYASTCSPLLKLLGDFKLMGIPVFAMFMAGMTEVYSAQVGARKANDGIVAHCGCTTIAGRTSHMPQRVIPMAVLVAHSLTPPLSHRLSYHLSVTASASPPASKQPPLIHRRASATW